MLNQNSYRWLFYKGRADNSKINQQIKIIQTETENRLKTGKRDYDHKLKQLKSRENNFFKYCLVDSNPLLYKKNKQECSSWRECTKCQKKRSKTKTKNLPRLQEHLMTQKMKVIDASQMNKRDKSVELNKTYEFIGTQSLFNNLYSDLIQQRFSEQNKSYSKMLQHYDQVIKNIKQQEFSEVNEKKQKKQVFLRRIKSVRDKTDQFFKQGI